VGRTAVNYDKVLGILKELSMEKFEKGHVTKDDPDYFKTLELDLNHYADILSLCPQRLNKAMCLEIGIGYAYLAVLVRRLLNYEVIGIEQGRRSYINNSRWRSLLNKEGIKLEISDVLHEPLCFESESFDVVFFCEVLEHLPISPRKLLKEIHRVLKKTGTLILTTPNFARLPNRVWLSLGRNPVGLLSDEPLEDPYYRHWREYTAKELTSMLEQTGFSIEKLYFSDCWDKSHKNFLYKTLPKLIPSFRSDIMITAKKSEIQRDKENK
jgi:SAM-dependent methyltransferase